MSQVPHSTGWRGRLDAFARRADAYFLSDELRSESANQVAYTRMGLLFCLAAGAGTLAYLPLQFSIWPVSVAGPTMLIAIGTLCLPFLLRQTRGMRTLGQLVCAMLAAGSATSIWMSGGQAIGVLPFLPMLPVMGLLVRGGRAALGWGVVALGIAAAGILLIESGAEPTTRYDESSFVARYAVAVICVLGMTGIAQLFENFWNRTAIEVANRAQAELMEREEHSRNLLEIAHEGVMIIGADATVKFASPAAERLLALEPGQAIGRRLRDLSEAADSIRDRSVWDDVVGTPDGVARVQVTTRPGAGAGDPAEARVLDVMISNRLDNPAVDGVIVRMRDITDQTRAEANYEALVEHSLQGIAVECDGKIVYANQALADLFGTSRDYLRRFGGKEGLRYTHEDDRQLIQDAYQSSESGSASEASPGSVEMRLRRRDGSWRWVELRWTDASWEGRPARQIAYADITAQKELTARQEREHERLGSAIRERTRELEASQRSLRERERMGAVGTLAAGIAHQINNPIGAILTSADFAILTKDEEDAERIRSDALADIRVQAIRCGKIVRSILQFSRSEATEKWSGDITDVLRTAVDVTARYAKECDARVEADYSQEVSNRTVSMNPIELEQVFVNLIRNALEAQESGATVRLSTRVVGKEIEIIVEDDGPGVSKTHANHIFEPFYTTRLRDGGTGLGLSVAHGIIEDHAGSMWLAPPHGSAEPGSVRHSGARFHIVLPVESSDGHAAERDRASG